MSQKLHLDAGILRIHGLDVKLLRADDLDLLFIRIIVFNVSLAEITAGLMLVNDLGLVLL